MYANMYFNFENFLNMSLLNEQANLSLPRVPTTKTTEMIEISITFISSLFSLFLGIFVRKVSAL